MSALRTWVGDTAVRAVKTASQALVALFGAGAFNILHGVDWKTDLGIALGAGVVSVLQNVQSLPLGTKAVAEVAVEIAHQSEDPNGA